MINIRLLLILGVLTLIVGCSRIELFGPDDPRKDEILELVGPDELRINGIRVTLAVSPAVINSPGTAIATLTYENLGEVTVALTSSYGCLSFAAVYLGDDRIPFPSTQYACTAAFSSRDLEPGRPIVVEWPLVVGDGGLHLPDGTYRFVADLNTSNDDLEQTFVIQ